MRLDIGHLLKVVPSSYRLMTFTHLRDASVYSLRLANVVSRVYWLQT